jgi:hypothetical protein
MSTVSDCGVFGNAETVPDLILATSSVAKIWRLSSVWSLQLAVTKLTKLKNKQTENAVIRRYCFATNMNLLGWADKAHQ